jgi:hypothetical protein
MRHRHALPPTPIWEPSNPTEQQLHNQAITILAMQDLIRDILPKLKGHTHTRAQALLRNGE